MQVRELAIAGAVEFSPTVFPDARGMFVAPYQDTAFRAAIGRSLRVAQTNHSVSRYGTLRGVHFADVPPGQAKYVQCPRGSALDIVVDLRVGSPTFGEHDVVELDALRMNSIYLAEGLGHAVLALEDHTVLSYLCSTEYNPAAEHGINPLDPALGLPWPAIEAPVLSDKDRAAPTVAQALDSGLLPDYRACLRCYDGHTVEE
ncbi:MAG: dTDP-4-dehydrorhamnose 3,5-epimerase family protein [Sciscionella sp.]